MKKIILFISILLCTTVLSAQKAIMLQDKGSLFKEEDGVMVWAKTLDRGTEIDLVSTEIISSKRTVDKKLIACDFYNVSYDGKKYYVLTDRVSIGQNPAVILKNCAVYKNLDIANVKSISIPAGEFVTVGQSAKANNIFNVVEVTYFDDAYYTIRTGYIKTDKKSDLSDDLTAIRIINKIKATKDNNIREELFATADSLGLSPEIFEMLKNLRNEYEAFNYGGEGSVEVSIDFVAYSPVEDGSIDVYSKPENWDEIVVSIPSGMAVKALMKTNKTYTIDTDHSYPWYYITYTDSNNKTYNGWVLEPSLKFDER